MSLSNLTPAQLRQAANLKEQIENLHKQLATTLVGNGSGMPSLFTGPNPGKRKISAAHIAKIRAAQKLRWAKVNAAKSILVAKSSPPKPVAKKGTISPAGIARIKAAQKARWAAIKAKAAPKPVAQKKGGINAEAKAKLSAKLKAYWAAKKKK